MSDTIRDVMQAEAKRIDDDCLRFVKPEPCGCDVEIQLIRYARRKYPHTAVATSFMECGHHRYARLAGDDVVQTLSESTRDDAIERAVFLAHLGIMLTLCEDKGIPPLAPMKEWIAAAV